MEGSEFSTRGLQQCERPGAGPCSDEAEQESAARSPLRAGRDAWNFKLARARHARRQLCPLER
eukprot:778580-Pyramimonas_sp.AAC.1